MKILFAGPNFLHPTTKGGQIRTLGILRWLSRRHEIHYVAYEDPAHPEAVALAAEYSARAYPVRNTVVDKRSPRFALQLAAGLLASTPLAISRYDSPAMRAAVRELAARERFDRMVVDFLAMVPCCPRLDCAALFQHNVETMIWRRHAANAADPARKLYFGLQARRMFAFERAACRAAGSVIAVSRADAQTMREEFGVERVTDVPTGVDLEYFARPAACERIADLVFVGSMDWAPNVDGVLHFVEETLPLIHRRRPECTLAVVGRTPPPAIAELARNDPRIRVTGTVPDVRPYLWGSGVAVVPLRIGGGTRLKIYESMAAGVPVVSTAVGAEGLEIHPPDDIRIADRPEDFAAQCLELLENEDVSRRIAARALELVVGRYSWERIAERFAEVLDAAPAWPRNDS